MSNDDTRRLLKVFGVAVTDFEDEATVLRERAAALAPDDDAGARSLLMDLSELLLDLNGKWADVSAHLAKVQAELLSAVAKATGGGR